MKKNKKILLWAGITALGITLALLFSGNSNHEIAVYQDHSAHQSKNIKTDQSKEEMEKEIHVIEIPMDKQQLIGVKVEPAKVMAFEKTIRASGKVEYDEKKLSTINTKTGGWIEKLYVDYNGQYIQKGKPLAEIYSPELVSTQQEFLQISKWLKGDKNLSESKDNQNIFNAAKERLKYWDISEKQINKIQETGVPVRTLTLYSPVSGYVIEKRVIAGMQVNSGEKLFDIADLSVVWVTADIYENELPYVKKGQKAVLVSSYDAGNQYTSSIDYIYPSLSGESRTGKIRFSVYNKDLKLKPQMYMNVELKINLGSRLSIPNEAVLETGTRQIVYIDIGKGYFEQRTVKIGLKGEEYSEVIKGIKPGEKVAVSANFLIDSEAQLKGTKVRRLHE